MYIFIVARPGAEEARMARACKGVLAAFGVKAVFSIQVPLEAGDVPDQALGALKQTSWSELTEEWSA